MALQESRKALAAGQEKVWLDACRCFDGCCIALSAGGRCRAASCLPFIFQMEREADYIGLQLMSKACFDPHEMPEVREKVVAEPPSLEGTCWDHAALLVCGLAQHLEAIRLGSFCNVVGGIGLPKKASRAIAAGWSSTSTCLQCTQRLIPLSRLRRCGDGLCVDRANEASREASLGITPRYGTFPYREPICKPLLIVGLPNSTVAFLTDPTGK